MYLKLSQLLLIIVVIAGCTKTADVSTDTEKTLFSEGFEDSSAVQQAWQSEGNISQDEKISHSGKGAVKISTAEPTAFLKSRFIDVKGKDFLRGSVWVRTADATGDSYFTLECYQGDKLLGKIKGGSPLETTTERYGFPMNVIHFQFRPVKADNNWTELMVRGFVPPEADRVRLCLQSDKNSGTTWFDDVNLYLVPAHKLQGKLDRNPLRIDASKLTTDDYITVKGDKLWYKGKRFRYWGAQGNLIAMTHADIDREVERFARCGFNGFRSLWWNREVTDDYVKGDCSEPDLRDYLIATLGQNGVFFWSDWLNSCQIRADKVNAIDEPATADEWVKAIKEYLGDREQRNITHNLFCVWDRRTRQFFFDYIKQVLAHRNPYTGLTYAEDPTFFCWELSNEQWWTTRMLWGRHLRLPKFFLKSLNDQWNQWLKDKYGTEEQLLKKWERLLEGESLEAGTILLLPLLGDTKPSELAKTIGLDVKFEKLKYSPKDFARARGGDVVEFLVKLHIRFKEEAKAVFKSQGRESLGNQVVPLIYDTGYSGALLPLYMASFADATATGFFLLASLSCICFV